jgi:acyl-CoA thioesterase I
MTATNFLRRVLLGAAVVVIASAGPWPARAEAVPEECAAPATLLATDLPLPALSAALQRQDPIRIVAIGGRSTLGTAAGTVGRPYPQQLQLDLAARFPAVSVTVFNKGGTGQTAADMVARFDRDVLAEKPDLVLWETGTVDAVERVYSDDFLDALQTGIDKLRDHHIDLILIDPQFSRSTSALVDFDPYLEALRRIAEINDLYLFPRYELMQYWAESGVFDFENAGKERAKFAAQVYRCIAANLADAISHAGH